MPKYIINSDFLMADGFEFKWNDVNFGKSFLKIIHEIPVNNTNIITSVIPLQFSVLLMGIIAAPAK